MSESSAELGDSRLLAVRSSLLGDFFMPILAVVRALLLCVVVGGHCCCRRCGSHADEGVTPVTPDSGLLDFRA